MKVAKSENRKEILLKDIFEDFNKDDLKDIAKMKGIKGISKLNKGPLIETIIEKMLSAEEMVKYFQYMTDEEIEAFRNRDNNEEDDTIVNYMVLHTWVEFLKNSIQHRQM